MEENKKTNPLADEQLDEVNGGRLDQKLLRESEREASSFVKQKLDSAKWFIEAIKQRHNTLQSTMQAILEFQREFFTDGERSI